MIALLNWGVAHWWTIWFLAMFGFFDGVRDFFFGLLDAITGGRERKHQRELELEKARAKTARAAKAPAAVRAGPCNHPDLVPVHIVSGERVAWLCKSPDCGRQLPPDYAAEQTELP